jgi:formylglycine-generating enzyme required for sulfatase activity
MKRELQLCVKLQRAKRTPCISQTEQWLRTSRSMSVTLGAGTEVVQTDCGPRSPVFAAQTRSFSATEVPAAEALLVQLSAADAAASSGGSNTVGMKFVSIAAGSFQMGSPSSEKDRDDDETQHPVRLTKSFLMATTEVTQGQWRAVMGSNPSVKDYKGVSFIGNTLPVQNVSWEDAVKFANALSKKEGLRAAYRISGKSVEWIKSSNGYRLPTEAEWEYAARAGKHRLYAGTDSLSSVCRYASVYTAQSKSKFGWDRAVFPCEDGHLAAAPVGSFKPNAWGLYDMTGNVWEWCWDRYDKKYGGSSTDPVGPQSGDGRVKRGGSWGYVPAFARVAFRFWDTPDNRNDYLGLRLVRTNP